MILKKNNFVNIQLLVPIPYYWMVIKDKTRKTWLRLLKILVQLTRKDESLKNKGSLKSQLVNKVVSIKKLL